MSLSQVRSSSPNHTWITEANRVPCTRAGAPALACMSSSHGFTCFCSLRLEQLQRVKRGTPLRIITTTWTSITGTAGLITCIAYSGGYSRQDLTSFDDALSTSERCLHCLISIDDAVQFRSSCGYFSGLSCYPRGSVRNFAHLQQGTTDIHRAQATVR